MRINLRHVSATVVERTEANLKSMFQYWIFIPNRDGI